MHITQLQDGEIEKLEVRQNVRFEEGGSRRTGKAEAQNVVLIEEI